MFGDKWSLLIIRDLMFKGKRHYGELADSEEGIATNVLADRLKRLCEHGILTKSRDSIKRSRHVYRLTEMGWDLLPVMLALVEWAARHDPVSEIPEAFLLKLRSEPEVLAREIREAGAE